MESALARVTGEKDDLVRKLASREEAHREEVVSMQAQHQAETARFEQSCRDMSADAHASVAAEKARAWEHALVATQLMGQYASSAIANANARADDAVARMEEYKMEMEEIKEGARVTATWAAHAFEQSRTQSLNAVLRAESRLQDVLKVLEARERETAMKLRAARAEEEAKVDARVQAVVDEMQMRMQKLMEEVDNSLAEARDWCGNLRDRISALCRENLVLRKRVQRRDARLEAIASASASEPAEAHPTVLPLKGPGGVIPEPIRDLVRELIALGLKVDQVHKAILSVATTLGVSVEGSINVHCGADADCRGNPHCASLPEHLSDLTINGDSTTHRHIDYLSRNVYLNDGDSHTRLSFGVHSAPNHKSATQLKGWKDLAADAFATYNASPRGQANPGDARSLAIKSRGSMSDHSEDQKKFSNSWQDYKRTCDRQVRGEKALASRLPDEVLNVLAEETSNVVEGAGGRDAWASLSEVEQQSIGTTILQSAILRLGEEEYRRLSAEEKAEVDLFVRGGCCMHKELNAVKGGYARMSAFWEKTGLQPPILLMNRDNEAASSSKDPGTRRQASSRSCGGAIKLVELAGAIFRHKDDKKGQQDSWRWYAESVLGRLTTFPDTSNTRFGSYAEAAAELIHHRDLYIQYLEFIRDKKESCSFNHLEQNVYRGLRDPPTLTELCVLALYGQAVGRPYMRLVRHGKLTNHLDLGTLHDNVKQHIRRIIADPDILLAADARHEDGALDGQPWGRPDLFAAIQSLSPTLPALREALVEFLEGALETWGRFTTEFAPSGLIAQLSQTQRQKAWMRPTNDDNEGALGTKRVRSRQAPNMSEHQYNARVLYTTNKTGTYIAELGPEDRAYLRREGRRLDVSGLEKKRRREVVDAEKQAVAEKRRKIQDRLDRLDEKRRQLLVLSPILTTADARLAENKLTVKQIEEHLDWHRVFHDNRRPKSTRRIPLKSALRNKRDKFQALFEAVTRYQESPLSVLPSLETLAREDEDGMEVDGDDTRLGEDEDGYGSENEL
ncbi:hypothetical protein C8T65DRAFT_639222 [Cerioporus squamosus]|nr:hypothetical protein C8T65DRAFT_639222 [Cerioporus squamosus]